MKIRQELQTKARNEGLAYRKVLTLFAMERFLYRLSKSGVADRFFLKGGMLLLGMGAIPARTTRDIDLLARINRTPENIRKVFKSILATKLPAEDQVSFSPDFQVSEIMKDALYSGVRVELKANVAGETCDISIDIGFSDEIYPEPALMEYPAMLEGLPVTQLLCYTRESVVAEKWQAVVQLGTFNSRMKDIYDLWFMARSYTFMYETLHEAIHRTFQRRGTSPELYTILKDASYSNEQQPEWGAFVAKLKAAAFHRKMKESIPPKDLLVVLSDILTWLEPVMESSGGSRWVPGKGWK